MIDKMDVKKGFWLAVGVLLAIFLWGLATGALGKIRG
jgi:hypothetical protein